MAKRWNFRDHVKAKVALEALRGDKTVQEIAAKHQLHPNQVSTWKRPAVDGIADVFSRGSAKRPDGGRGQRAARKDREAGGRERCSNWLSQPNWGHGPISDVRRAEAVSPAKKRARIKRDHPTLSVSQPCKLVRLSWPAFYYTPVGVNADTLAMMKEIDRLFTKYSFFGSHQIAAYLRREGTVVRRHRVRRLMVKMGMEAIYHEEIGDGFQARRIIKQWMAFYNTERAHSALDRRTPDESYWTGLEEQKEA